ncbi:TetR family transcriptional regulator [Pseudomonas sp. A46]|nr:TetR family transcriptional regulator [Pseudomonas sp. A46]
MNDSQPDKPQRSNHRVRKDKQEPAARRGRPVGDHNAKRSELLAAVVSVIAEEGYAGASLRKVAKRAGYTTGAVTYYFANKEEMVSAVAQDLFDKVDTLMERQEHIDVRALVTQLLDWTNTDEQISWLAWLQLLSHARQEPAFADVIKQRYARFREVFTAALKRGQKQGLIRKDIAADLLADQLSAMSDGWMMMLPIEPERFSDKRARALLDALITLISPATQKKPAKAK